MHPYAVIGKGIVPCQAQKGQRVVVSIEIFGKEGNKYYFYVRVVYVKSKKDIKSYRGDIYRMRHVSGIFQFVYIISYLTGLTMTR